jgi:phosphoribosylformylglycinamidine synthase subunit PurS
MKFIAEIDVMPLKEILDPQGKAVKLGLNNLGLESMDNIRVGKHISLEIEAQDRTEAEQKVETACRRLLANLIMEEYRFELHEA